MLELSRETLGTLSDEMVSLSAANLAAAVSGPFAVGGCSSQRAGVFAGVATGAVFAGQLCAGPSLWLLETLPNAVLGGSRSPCRKVGPSEDDINAAATNRVQALSCVRSTSYPGVKALNKD